MAKGTQAQCNGHENRCTRRRLCVVEAEQRQPRTHKSNRLTIIRPDHSVRKCDWLKLTKYCTFNNNLHDLSDKGYRVTISDQEV